MPLREDLLEPIPGGNPGGTSVRYEPVYDRIKEARREDLDVPQGEWQTALKTADWPLVIKLCNEVLATRSKDLQVAAWLTEALLKRSGFAGLREGLELTIELLQRFWESLYPELEDGDAELRAAPLEWVGRYLEGAVRAAPLTLGEYGLLHYQAARAIGYEAEAESDASRRDARKQAISEGKPTAEDFDRTVDATPKGWYVRLVADVEGSLDTLESLDRLGDERFGAAAPSFLNLRQALIEVRQVARSLLDRKRVAEPDPIGVVEVTAGGEGRVGVETAESPGGALGASGPIAAGGAPVLGTPALPVVRTESEVATRIAAAARFLRAASAANPAAYLLLRGYRWGELRAGGDDVDPKLLEAPPTDARSRLKGLLLDERWNELLEAGEELMASPFGRGWLDLQRYSVTACDALGGEFEPLGTALRSALRSLLRDLPYLPTLTLMDDSPTANAETQQWLAAEGITAESPAAPSASVVSQRPRGRRDALERAQEWVRTGNPRAAVELLMDEAAVERSPRERFLRRLQATGILVDAGLESVARPMLDEMATLVDSHQLEGWETGETVARPLGLLYRCMLKIEGESSSSHALFLRISRLDPLLAIQLSNGAADGGSGE